MRYLKIFLLNFQKVFEQRGRSAVWFFLTLINPLVLLLYWNGSNISTQWSSASRTSYYLLIVITSSLLISHVEEDVSFYDIRQGGLVSKLLKPFPYYWFQFFMEIPYRILQGIYGIIVLYIILIMFPYALKIELTPHMLALGFITCVLSYFMSYTYKLILGLTAFWIPDIWGIYQLTDVVFFIFSGNIMPLHFYPNWLKEIALFLPFAHIIYYPVLIIQGQLSLLDSIQAISFQLIWLAVLISIFKIMWHFGVRKFSGVGQ